MGGPMEMMAISLALGVGAQAIPDKRTKQILTLGSLGTGVAGMGMGAGLFGGAGAGANIANVEQFVPGVTEKAAETVGASAGNKLLGNLALAGAVGGTAGDILRPQRPAPPVIPTSSVQSTTPQPTALRAQEMLALGEEERRRRRGF